MTELAKWKLKVAEILNDQNKSRLEQQKAIGELIDDILSGGAQNSETETPKHWPGMYEPDNYNSPYYYLGPISDISICRTWRKDEVKFERQSGICCETEKEAEFVKAHMEARLEVTDRLAELNEGWRPQKGQNMWYPFLVQETGEIDFTYASDTQILPDWFQGKTLTIWKEVVSDLGEEKVKLAIWPKYEEERDE